MKQGYSEWVENYIFDKDATDDNYINLNNMDRKNDLIARNILAKNPSKTIISRKTIFTLENMYGFNLLRDTTGTGILLKINNNIFVHGQLQDNLQNIGRFIDINRINNLLNEEDINPDIINKKIDELNERDSILWKRTYGNPELINERLASIPKTKLFCENVMRDIIMFLGRLGQSVNPKDIRIIVGHCGQGTMLEPSMKDYINQTFKSENMSTDNIKEIYTNKEIYKGKSTIDNNFGITVDCINENNPQLIKVDVNMSRAFDFEDDMGHMLTNGENDKHYFKARVPQVIEIIGNKIQIIKSTLANIKIHLDRSSYVTKLKKEIKYNDSLIEDLEPYRYHDSSYDDHVKKNINLRESVYYNKYIKYKNKYINLRKQNNEFRVT